MTAKLSEASGWLPCRRPRLAVKSDEERSPEKDTRALESSLRAFANSTRAEVTGRGAKASEGGGVPGADSGRTG
jgi:hypothetical protein